MYNFLKKTFCNIEICLNDRYFTDLSTILEFFHLMTISIKILSTNPSDLYECIYPLEYKNYYFNTFCIFIEFIKSDINKNYLYNKFIINIIKYLYLFYYDYYFYYSNIIEILLIN